MAQQQRPLVEAFFDQATNTVTYLIADPATRQAAVIDAVLDFDYPSGRVTTASADALVAHARGRGFDIVYALETHAHADHLSGAQRVKELTGALVIIGEDIKTVQETFKPLFAAADVAADGSAFDRLVADGESLKLGELTIEVLHTPGHTPACVTYVVGDAAFVGDTIFMPDYGTARADFPGGDAARLYRSIRRILSLPEETRLFVGHDYPGEARPEPAWESSVREEKARNIHVGGDVGEAGFVEMRTKRDKTLGAPRLLLPSLQVNIRAGHMPPPDADGRRRLRIPLTLPG